MPIIFLCILCIFVSIYQPHTESVAPEISSLISAITHFLKTHNGKKLDIAIQEADWLITKQLLPHDRHALQTTITAALTTKADCSFLIDTLATHETPLSPRLADTLHAYPWAYSRFIDKKYPIWLGILRYPGDKEISSMPKTHAYCKNLVAPAAPPGTPDALNHLRDSLQVMAKQLGMSTPPLLVTNWGPSLSHAGYKIMRDPASRKSIGLYGIIACNPYLLHKWAPGHLMQQAVIAHEITHLRRGHLLPAFHENRSWLGSYRPESASAHERLFIEYTGAQRILHQQEFEADQGAVQLGHGAGMLAFHKKWLEQSPESVQATPTHPSLLDRIRALEKIIH